MPLHKPYLRLSMRQNFFIKSFLLNCLFSLVPLLIIGPFSLIITNQEIESSIRKSNYNMLYQIRENIDSLLEAADNVNLYFSYNPSIMSQLRSAFREESLSPSGINSIRNMTIYLQNITNTNPYIHSAYIYYSNPNGRFLSSEKGMVNLNNYYDTQWYNSYNDSDVDIWFDIGEVKPYEFSTPIPTISAYRKLYTSLSPDKSTGVLVMQYDLRQITKYLSSLELHSSQIITILDKSGQVILQNQSMNIYSAWDSLSTYLEQENPIEVYPIKINKETYIASLVHSERSDGWTYLSLVLADQLYAASYSLIKTLLLLSIIAVLFSFFIAYIKADKDYKRLENILNILNSPDTPIEKYPPMPNRNTDLYGYIVRNIIEIFIQQNYLKIQISEKKYRTQFLEMRALQQQINPHFLYNTLHTIYWEALRITNTPNTCTQMISHLSDLMEYALGDANKPVKIKEELDYLEHYLKIQEIRYGNQFEVVWKVDESAVIYNISKMILQPLVENSIYHGLKNRKGKGRIKIKVLYHPTHIYICIIDNGLGMSKEQLIAVRAKLTEESITEKHIGLVNTNRRLILAYGEFSKVCIVSRLHVGTCVSFSLPIIPPVSYDAEAP